jgi:RNA polymerase sigma-70 factor (ECF subfamily)
MLTDYREHATLNREICPNSRTNCQAPGNFGRQLNLRLDIPRGLHHILRLSANYHSGRVGSRHFAEGSPVNTMSGPVDTPRGLDVDLVQSLTGAQSRLYAYICSLLGESAGARDVLQETNLALWDKVRDYDPSRPFLPWAYRIAYLQVLAYRKRCARNRLLFDDQLVSELAEQVMSRDDDLDLRLEALSDCMARLPAPRREMLDRRYLHGESVDQIAEHLRKAPNVVAACLYRIRKTLLECIESRIATE